MNTIAMENVHVSPLEALWTLFKTQPKAVRKAFTEKLLHDDVEAETMRKKLVVKESLTQALRELEEAEMSGEELPDARNLFE